MTTSIEQRIAALGRMTPAQLREKYLEVFGEPSRSGNRGFLFKRIAWRIQANAEGGLSERARRRAEELARDADLRTTLPRPPKVAAGAKPVRGRITPQQVRAGSEAHDALLLAGTAPPRTSGGRRMD